MRPPAINSRTSRAMTQPSVQNWVKARSFYSQRRIFCYAWLIIPENTPNSFIKHSWHVEAIILAASTTLGTWVSVDFTLMRSCGGGLGLGLGLGGGNKIMFGLTLPLWCGNWSLKGADWLRIRNTQGPQTPQRTWLLALTLWNFCFGRCWCNPTMYRASRVCITLERSYYAEWKENGGTCKWSCYSIQLQIACVHCIGRV